MKNLLKYLIVAAFGLILHGAADKLDAQLAFASVADLAGECIQYQQEECTLYQHSVYEPESGIYAVSSNNTVNNTLRLNKKNKRAGAWGKWCPEFAKNYKSPLNEIHSSKVYKTSICNPYLAVTGHKLICLGKLII